MFQKELLPSNLVEIWASLPKFWVLKIPSRDDEIYQQNLLRWRRCYYVKNWRFYHRAPMWGGLNVWYVSLRLLVTPFLKSGLLKHNLQEIKFTLFSGLSFCQMHSQVTTTTTRILKSSITPPVSSCTFSQPFSPAPVLDNHWSVLCPYSFASTRVQCEWNQQHGDFGV